MTGVFSDGQSVRSYVSENTRAIHEALHHNPILERLIDPEITPLAYRTALQLLQCFYSAVERERKRLDTWDAFALTAECNALAQDLAGHPAQTVSLTFEDPAALLGGLYVAHGASFGRAQFRKNLSTHLPDAPQAFVNQRTSKETWRLLTDCMNSYGQSAAQRGSLFDGASRGFQAVAAASALFERRRELTA